jgi:hypothetical protein
VSIFELTEPMHAKWSEGPLKLYVFDFTGFHNGGKWVVDTVRYPGEELTTAAAKQLINKAMQDKREIRICDGGDMLVFHAVDGEIVYNGITKKEKMTFKQALQNAGRDVQIQTVMENRMDNRECKTISFSTGYIVVAGITMDDEQNPTVEEPVVVYTGKSAKKAAAAITKWLKLTE